mmetsp:Transcript_11939/g.44381  ORF Transcript_11939/g.44381 Transcript_11939/m.44381 type:complete len:519 (-) Transcript_11939:50-1606(-)
MDVVRDASTFVNRRYRRDFGRRRHEAEVVGEERVWLGQAEVGNLGGARPSRPQLRIHGSHHVLAAVVGKLIRKLELELRCADQHDEFLWAEAFRQLLEELGLKVRDDVIALEHLRHGHLVALHGEAHDVVDGLGLLQELEFRHLQLLELFMDPLLRPCLAKHLCVGEDCLDDVLPVCHALGRALHLADEDGVRLVVLVLARGDSVRPALLLEVAQERAGALVPEKMREVAQRLGVHLSVDGGERPEGLDFAVLHHGDLIQDLRQHLIKEGIHRDLIFRGDGVTVLDVAEELLGAALQDVQGFLPVDHQAHEVGAVVPPVEIQQNLPNVHAGLPGLVPERVRVARAEAAHRMRRVDGHAQELHLAPHVRLHVLAVLVVHRLDLLVRGVLVEHGRHEEAAEALQGAAQTVRTHVEEVVGEHIHRERVAHAAVRVQERRVLVHVRKQVRSHKAHVLAEVRETSHVSVAPTARVYTHGRRRFVRRWVGHQQRKEPILRQLHRAILAVVVGRLLDLREDGRHA